MISLKMRKSLWSLGSTDCFTLDDEIIRNKWPNHEPQSLTQLSVRRSREETTGTFWARLRGGSGNLECSNRDRSRRVNSAHLPNRTYLFSRPKRRSRKVRKNLELLGANLIDIKLRVRSGIGETILLTIWLVGKIVARNNTVDDCRLGD